jgi:GNAT superfamily N-acetyltransferase
LNAVAHAIGFKTRFRQAQTIEPMSNAFSDIASVTLHTGYVPGVIGRIGELHGRYYADAWGSGAPFEIQVLRGLSDFVERYTPERDLLLTAHVGEVVAGSLVVAGGVEPDAAQLRFVIVDPAYHGRGIGKSMLTEGLAWCRARGYRTVFLWTVEGLPASRAMYDAAGFRVVHRVEDARYSMPLTSLRMELTL